MVFKLFLSFLLVLPAAFGDGNCDPASGTCDTSGPASVIEPSLLESFKTKTSTSILIDFKSGTSEALKSLEGRTFTNRQERLKAVNQALEDNAAKSQKAVQDYLRGQNVEFTSFWINNSISVKIATLELVEALAKFEEVGKIREDGVAAHILS